jgi:hypothetical protein
MAWYDPERPRPFQPINTSKSRKQVSESLDARRVGKGQKEAFVGHKKCQCVVSREKAVPLVHHSADPMLLSQLSMQRQSFFVVRCAHGFERTLQADSIR